MGLDGVELLLAIEEEFSVEIPDHDAEQINTVGQIFEWLKKRVATGDPVECLTQRIFYKLRKALMKNYRLARNDITPDTKLSDIIPLKEMEESWPFLQLFIELELPAIKNENGYFGYKVNKKTITVRGLIYDIIQKNYAVLSPKLESEEEIWNRLVEVFVRQLNVRPDEVRYDASITSDLGVD